MMERALPPFDSISEPFWEATRRDVLSVQQCHSCQRYVFYPREFCPACGSRELHWQDVDPSGDIYSLSRHAAVDPAGESYLVALVDIAPGLRLITNIVGPEADAAAIGDRVVVSWEPLSDGRKLPMFRRAS